MRLSPVIRLAFSLMPLTSSVVLADPSSEDSERLDAALVRACYACHASDGHSHNRDLPAIDKLDEKELLARLQEFQSNPNSGTVMPRIASGYQPGELRRIAHYLSQH